MPSAAIPPRRKRPVTYGKNSRNVRNDLPSAFEPFNPPEKANSPSKLPRVSSSPKTVSLAPTTSTRTFYELGNFDVPSSEDEHPPTRSAFSTSRSSPRGVIAEPVSEVNSKRGHLSLEKPLPLHHHQKKKRKRKFDGVTNEESHEAPNTSATTTTQNPARLRARSSQDESTQEESVSDVRKKIRSVRVQNGVPPTLNRDNTAAAHAEQRRTIKASVMDVSASELTIEAFTNGHDRCVKVENTNSSNDMLWGIPDSDSESEVKRVGKKSTPNHKKASGYQQEKFGRKFAKRAPKGAENTTSVSKGRRELDGLAKVQIGNGSATTHEAQRPSTPNQRSPVSENHSRRSPSYLQTTQSPTNSAPVSQRRGITTPKQARLWTTLLQDETSTTTPSRDLVRLSLDQLETSGSPDKSSKRTIPRKRLIDTLISSASGLPGDMADPDEASCSDETSVSGREPENKTSDDALRERNLSSDYHTSYNAETESPRQTRAAARGPKFTYSGQRTHLADSGDTLENLLAQPLDLGISPIAETSLKSHQEPYLKSDETKTEDYPDESEDGTRAVRTIHDLRAGGDSERFGDEVSEIIDDLVSSRSSLSRKRAAVMELCQKLGDSMFRIRFIRGGHDFQIFRACSSETDAIIGAATAATLILILGPDGSSSNPAHLYDAGILGMLSRMLSFKRDLTLIAKDRSNNMSRVAQVSVEKLCRQMIEAPLRKEKRVHSVSPMSLALAALELSVRRLREAGNTEALLDADLLGNLLDILTSYLQHARDSDIYNVDVAALDQLETVLSILESCTTVAACALDNSLWDERSLGRLVAQLDCAMSISMPRERATQQLIPRLSLNLANNNSRTSQMFAGGNFIQQLSTRIVNEFSILQAAPVDNSLDLDNLLLPLGALLNLAEWSDEARKAVTRRGNAQLDSLIRIFLQGRKQAGDADSLAASQANVAFAWLAVLLGNLCQNAEIRNRIRFVLPGDGLSAVVEAVDEFIVHHKEADKTAHGNAAYVHFTERLQTVADTLRTFLSNHKREA